MIIRTFNRCSGLCTPGVSRKAICPRVVENAHPVARRLRLGRNDDTLCPRTRLSRLLSGVGAACEGDYLKDVCLAHMTNGSGHRELRIAAWSCNSQFPILNSQFRSLAVIIEPLTPVQSHHLHAISSAVGALDGKEPAVLVTVAPVVGTGRG